MKKTVTREKALQKVARELDILPSKYREAMERFKSIRSYLLKGKYEGATGQPEIYLQGSFKLGTEIRPYKKSEYTDYDIDVVCCLNHRKEETTPKIVKHQVGDHLKSSGKYKRMLDNEGKRCWTINYAEQDGVGFHIDILPSIQGNLNLMGSRWYSSVIELTNKCSDTGTYDWLPSNPKGFAKWFYDKNKTVFENVRQNQKRAIFEKYQQDKLFADWNEVPDIHVKTPLQRTIQLLKRHRDISFCGLENEKCKPISMIITVLSAQIYRNENTIYETLKNLLDKLSRHADQMLLNFRFDESKAQSVYNLITKTDDGKWCILNPANPGENFADKWHEEENGVPHARADAFFQWVKWAKEYFINVNYRLDEEHYTNSLVFPVNNDNLLSVSQSKEKQQIFNVDHRQKPPWPISLKYSAQISAQIEGVKSFNSSDPLRKNHKLVFSTETNVPKPFKVFWQVVNTGKEAEEAEDLRGKICSSKTEGAGGLKFNQKEEITRYRGIHWIESFIVKNGVCVARSGEFLVKIK